MSFESNRKNYHDQKQPSLPHTQEAQARLEDFLTTNTQEPKDSDEKTYEQGSRRNNINDLIWQLHHALSENIPSSDFFSLFNKINGEIADLPKSPEKKQSLKFLRELTSLLKEKKDVPKKRQATKQTPIVTYRERGTTPKPFLKEIKTTAQSEPIPEREEGRLFSAIWEKIQQTQQASRLDTAQFDDLISPDEINDDKSRLEQFGFQDKNKVYATAFETYIFDMINNQDWLGPEVQALPSSEFDDQKNGVDILLEINTPLAEEPLHICIDLTFGQTTLEKKIKRILKSLKDGNLGNVKYFHSPQTETREINKEHILHVVAGTQKTQLFELLKDWQTNTAGANQKEFKILLLDQIMLQIIKQRDFLLKAPEAISSLDPSTRLKMLTILGEFSRQFAQIQNNINNKNGINIQDLPELRATNILTRQLHELFDIPLEDTNIQLAV
ncbi:hypothetical protein KKG22_03395 [Patescibacteria group bacterium]|nr:hypothetical protein [Patescibacteria group bacterium]MBU1721194.1 hypothetical protein [Patescibacteria group bacterium]MBU1901098.1 hypothetical protein [Patescibacteria group bacterium]